MILADTNIWADHLRVRDEMLMQHLKERRIIMHPFVKGELAMGSLADRQGFLEAMDALPAAPEALDEEVIDFVGRHGLHGLGIGFIDAHLLASIRLVPNGRLWTRDKRLRKAAAKVGIATGVVN